ncbi:hypothetical protein [Thermomonas sp.]|uniref:hypothetical protein n=1 Tax=Thermomonas sp. TaxID=1971895 RepID=UPI001EC85AA6|nr:hypothetical protein [Thermomonas sp.]MBK6415360.1 hypothetical protein [Thermomonas sp.]
MTDDGATRSVRVLDSMEYGYNRGGCTFLACLREAGGQWRHVPATDPNVGDPGSLPAEEWAGGTASGTP